jgi:hypothetical protein
MARAPRREGTPHARQVLAGSRPLVFPLSGIGVYTLYTTREYSAGANWLPRAHAWIQVAAWLLGELAQGRHASIDGGGWNAGTVCKSIFV